MLDRDDLIDDGDDLRLIAGAMGVALVTCLASLGHSLHVQLDESSRAAELAREEYLLNVTRTWPEQVRQQFAIARAIYCDPPAD